jgi:acyl-CoA synthetase (AMP-forming)/AMP-acid ligase II
VKIGGDGFKTRVVDGILQIKAESAMLGYLNAPSPFTDDGWFITGDEVEIDGDYYLIKGRRSEMINVGGQKVYPAEVENVILQMDGVLDAVITGEKNPILGKIVMAKVHLADKEETVKDFIRRMKIFCKDKLRPFQIPQKVTIEQKDFTNSRFKKIRNY